MSRIPGTIAKIEGVDHVVIIPAVMWKSDESCTDHVAVMFAAGLDLVIDKAAI